MAHVMVQTSPTSPALPCESRIVENVVLQGDITKKIIIASSEWTRVILCLKFTDMGWYVAMHVSNKDI